MVVDEFGREIPAPAGGGDASHSYHHPPSQLESSTSASASSPQHLQQHHQQPRQSSSSSYHDSSYSRQHRPYPSRYTSGTSRSSSSGGGGGMRGTTPRGHAVASHFRTTASSSVGGGGRLRHISFQYASEPLLCQYVWKDKQQQQQQQREKQQQQQEKEDDTDNNKQQQDADDDTDNDNTNKTTSPQEETTTITNQVVDKQPQPQQQDEATAETADNNPQQDETKMATASSSAAEYDAYRRKYCLNYIRAFFNQHLDDTWFRAQYSPACQQAWLKQEHERSCEEAKAIWKQIMSKKMATKRDHQPSNENRNAETITAAAEAPPTRTHPFIERARLGGGQKASSSLSSSPSSSSPSSPVLSIPTSHLFSWQQPDDNTTSNTQAALFVSEIPPSVTDDQIIFGLLQQCNSSSSNNNTLTITKDMEQAVRVYGMNANTIPTTGRSVLQRQAVVLAPRAIVDNILQTLSAASTSTVSSSSNNNTGSSSRQATIPRRKDDYYTSQPQPQSASQQQEQQQQQQQWQIQVDCTDPYGRAQYDANGKGQAPADGLAVPPQKARLLVSKILPSSTPIAVLSAAMSSTQQLRSIANDAATAQEMARNLDTARQIPADVNWNAVHQVLFGSSSSSSSNDDDNNNNSTADAVAAGETADNNNNTGDNNNADILDVCIAYLRRVHLVSFYQSAEQPAAGLAQVVGNKHPVSMIRLRLNQADDILAEAAVNAAVTTTTTTEEDKTAQPVDLLVQRLDASLETARANFAEWASGNNGRNYLGLSAEQVAQAAEIQHAEAAVQATWLQDHTIIDNDQRARCSFHFCHKLFKDTTFLHKHLLKKHAEYLVAEQAKCHDAHMMKAWDAATERPAVPDILVDCGSRFGLVAAAVTGQVPDCVDPEPELWRREEERRQQEMRLRREEVRHQQQQQHPAGRDMGSSSGELHAPRPASNFVDVDDMKVEKVELSFENVEVPPVVNKKKKKKRKLL